MELEKVFKTSLVERDKFLSRVFGIFSEKIVEIWCKSPKGKYKNLGRPTIKINKDGKGKTLDFALQHKKTGSVYVTEMKCLLQYGNYKYLKLNSAVQLDIFKNKEAFQWFLKLGKNPNTFKVTVDRKIQKVEGTILIWGVVDPLKKADICKKVGLKEILSLETMIIDLKEEKNEAYFDLVNMRSLWISYLTEHLKRRTND